MQPNKPNHKLKLFSLIFISLTGCLPKALKQEQDKLDNYYQLNAKPQVKIKQMNYGQLSYIESGDTNKSTVIFLHGTPGSAEFFSSYINHTSLQEKAHLIAVDRPGWGHSTINEGVELNYTLYEQSQFLGDWICQLAQNSASGKVILVGHSYGATLAPILAMDYPQCVSAMVLLAGAADPDLAQPRWYNRLTRTRVFGSLIKLTAKQLYQSNKEMLPIQTGLEKIRSRWREIKQDVVVVHGGKDKLVHPKHLDFIKQEFINAKVKTIYKPDQGHFILFEDLDMVVAEIIELLN